MSLAKRVKRLQNQGKQVTINKYYLFDTSSYYAKEWVTRFFLGFGCVMILAFIIFWPTSYIINDQKNSSNVELQRVEAQKETQRRVNIEKAKQQYIDSCKAAGTKPTDMGDRESFWKCA